MTICQKLRYGLVLVMAGEINCCKRKVGKRDFLIKYNCGVIYGEGGILQGYELKIQGYSIVLGGGVCPAYF